MGENGIAFTMSLGYSWKGPSVLDYLLLANTLSVFDLFILALWTVFILYWLIFYIVQRLRKRPTIFFLSALVGWYITWHEVLFGESLKTTPGLSLYLTVHFLLSLVLFSLCLWIDIMNGIEYRRRMKGTESPPSPPAT
jgi:hypothetical protein